MFIEDQIETELINWLSFIYQKEDERTIFFILYLRCCIYLNKKEVSCEELCSFILKELNLPNNFKYNDIEISSNFRYADNSLLNIVDNFIFRYLEMPYNDSRKGLISGHKFILDTFSKISQSARNKFRGIKKDDKRFLTMYLMFNLLNEEFELKINKPILFENVNYTSDHNVNVKTIDEICSAYYEEYITKKEKILERDLEKYIFKNGILDIKILKRQYRLKNGIIDLYGIDKDGINVLIELKVTDKPRDLVWQINLYQSEFKQLLKLDNFRTIVVCPGLDDTIKTILPLNVEVILFKKYKNEFTFSKAI